MRPAEIILDHLEAVREALAQATGPKGAWQHLCGACPDLAGALPFNTFKTVAPVVLATAERLHRDCATSLRPGSTTPTAAPKTFEGWSVQTDAKGYIRAHRKIGGKVLSVYVGRTWDAAKARTRIDAKVSVCPRPTGGGGSTALRT